MQVRMYHIWTVGLICTAIAMGCSEILGLGGIVVYDGGGAGQAPAGAEETTGAASGGGGGVGTVSGSGAEPAGDPWRSSLDLVSAAGAAESSSYRLVLSLGQSTSNQVNATSASYRLRGGAVGATGSKQ